MNRFSQLLLNKSNNLNNLNNLNKYSKILKINYTTTINKEINENNTDENIDNNNTKKLNSKERNILLRKSIKLNQKLEKLNSLTIESNIKKNELEKTIDLDKVKLPRCTGCGCNLQTTSPKEPGYIPDSIAIKHIEKLNKDKLDKNNNNNNKNLDENNNIEKEDKSGEEYFNRFYIIKKKLNENKVCQRCHVLKNYGRVAPITIPIEKFKDNLNQLKNLNCVIIKVVDLMDFNGTFIEDFRDIIGNNPVIIVGNKMDLLPNDVYKDRIEQWIRSEAKKRGLSHVSHVKLISSVSGDGIKQFIIELEKLRRGRDVFIVGCSNVGKSTFVNTLLEEYNNRVEFTTKDKLEAQSGDQPLSIQEQKDLDREKLLRSLQSKITTSVLPGTTLNLLSLPLWDNSTLFDTPGVDNPRQMIKLLSIDELKQVIPSKRIKPTLAHMIEGKTLFIGGIARIDFLGPLSTFMIYTSNSIPLHLTSTKKADDLLRKHQGILLTPPIINSLKNYQQKQQQQQQQAQQAQQSLIIDDDIDQNDQSNNHNNQMSDEEITILKEKERLSNLTPFELERLDKFKFKQVKTFNIRPDKIDFKHTYVDLVISGLGWISIKCLSKSLNNSKILVHTPENIDVSLRKPLIPLTESYSNIK